MSGGFTRTTTHTQLSAAALAQQTQRIDGAGRQDSEELQRQVRTMAYTRTYWWHYINMYPDIDTYTTECPKQVKAQAEKIAALRQELGETVRTVNSSESIACPKNQPPSYPTTSRKWAGHTINRSSAGAPPVRRPCGRRRRCWRAPARGARRRRTRRWPRSGGSGA